MYLKDKDGRTFHLTVVGETDINTRAQAITVPKNIATSTRCPGTMTITTPSTGQVVLDFNVNGRTGSCNQCGECCRNCAYLTVITAIGQVNGTSCSIYRNLMYEGCKTCVNFPQEAFEIADCPACGFSFS